MCIKDSINKTCWKNGKDLSNGASNIKLWNHTKKPHFPVFAKNFRRPCMKLKIFFCQFPNPWTFRVSGMGGYTSKCEKSQNHCTLMRRPLDIYDFAPDPFWSSLYMRKIQFSFLSLYNQQWQKWVWILCILYISITGYILTEQFKE